MSDVEGLRLLANHLAKVKLEAAENRYELSRLLKITQGKNEELEGEVCRLKQLCRENTLHWRLQERDDWKALVEAVQKDRSRLERENEISDRDFFATAASHLVRPCPRST